MPDPERRTVSASQVAALFGASRWSTRWSLWHAFVGDAPLPDEESDLMKWGLRLQDDILDGVADELHLSVTGWDDEAPASIRYVRHPSEPVGATPDGWALDPEGRLIWIEAKNVNQFSFMDHWTETTAPLDVEMQVQTQLMVPHPDHGAPKMAYIAALVGGCELRLYPREPDAEVQRQIADEARAFLASVKAGEEPPVEGREIEIPQLLALYPDIDPEKIVHLDAEEEIEIVRMHRYWREAKSQATKIERDLRVKVMALARDAGLIVAPKLSLGIKKATVAATSSRREHVRTSLKYSETTDDWEPVPTAEGIEI